MSKRCFFGISGCKACVHANLACNAEQSIIPETSRGGKDSPGDVMVEEVVEDSICCDNDHITILYR